MIERVLTPRTRAIIAVHLAGWPCEMEETMALARAHDLKVIEDCAQAHGAALRGRPVGSFGDASAFSYCTDKIIRSEEHTSELQSLMRISYAVFCLKKKKKQKINTKQNSQYKTATNIKR